MLHLIYKFTLMLTKFGFVIFEVKLRSKIKKNMNFFILNPKRIFYFKKTKKVIGTFVKFNFNHKILTFNFISNLNIFISILSLSSTKFHILNSKIFLSLFFTIHHLKFSSSSKTQKWKIKLFAMRQHVQFHLFCPFYLFISFP